MKMTLEIPDDVLRAAEEVARCEHKTAGEVISDLARKALLSGPPKHAPTEFLGFHPFLSRGGIVTNEIINDLREKDGVYARVNFLGCNHDCRPMYPVRL